MLWLFVGPTGVYLLDFFCSGIQFNLLLSPYPCIVQTGQGLGEMPQLQILTIISESVLLTCIRLYSGSVGSLATSSHQSQPSLHYRYTVYCL